MSVYCDRRWMYYAAKYILEHDVCSEDYLSLLDMDIDGLVKKFNLLDEGYEKLLFGEEMDRFVNNCKPPTDWVTLIPYSKQFLKWEKEFHSLAKETSFSGQDLFYSYYGNNGLTFDEVERAFAIAERIVKGDEIGKLWRFSTKYYDLARQIEKRRRVFETMRDYPENCSKLESLINAGNVSKEVGMIRFEGNKESDAIPGTRQEMEISNLIGEPFTSVINKVSKDSTPTITFFPFDSLDEDKKNLVRTEIGARETLKSATGVEKVGYVSVGNYATLSSALVLLDNGINPVNLGFECMGVNVKPVTVFSRIINAVEDVSYVGVFSPVTCLKLIK